MLWPQKKKDISTCSRCGAPLPNTIKASLQTEDGVLVPDVTVQLGLCEGCHKSILELVGSTSARTV